MYIDFGDIHVPNSSCALILVIFPWLGWSQKTWDMIIISGFLNQASYIDFFGGTPVQSQCIRLGLIHWNGQSVGGGALTLNLTLIFHFNVAALRHNRINVSNLG